MGSMNSLFPGIGVSRFQRLIVLRSFPAYQELPAEDVVVVSERTVERFFAAGDYLHREGQPFSSIHFVVRGLVQTKRHGSVVREFGPQTVVGGVGALAREPDGYDCIALEDTTTLELSSDDAEEIFEDNFRVTRSVIQRLSGELVHMRRDLGPHAGFSMNIAEPLLSPTRNLDLVERMRVLRQSMTFAQSRMEALSELARDARELCIAKDELAWQEGDPSGHTLIVVNGLIEGTVPDTGQRFLLGPGDSVGGPESLANLPRWFEARAKQPTVALRIDTEILFDLLEDHFDISISLLRAIARGVMVGYDKIAEFRQSKTALAAQTR